MLFKNCNNILKEKTLDEDKRDVILEKGDLGAMIIAAFTMLLPTLLFVFLIFGLVIYVLFA